MSDKPSISWVGLEFIIMVKEIRYNDGWVGNVHHIVNVFDDGSVFAKEVLVKPRGAKETMSFASAKSFNEFTNRFPEDAKVIVDYVKECGIIIPWMR